MKGIAVNTIKRGEAMAKGFRVSITDEEYEFLKKMAKNDGTTVRQKVQWLLSLQIREEMELEENILKGEQ